MQKYSFDGVFNVIYGQHRPSGWNHEFWLRVMKAAHSDGDMDKVRALRAEVFNDTVTHSAVAAYVTPNANMVTIAGEEQMVAKTRLYNKPIGHEPYPLLGKTAVLVWEMDTIVAAKRLQDAGYRPVALNLASRRHPGGGVTWGSGAQEESLFRRTNLFRSMFRLAPIARKYELPMSAYQYPLDRDWGGVYTPGACVFRATEAEGYRLLENPFLLDFVAVPAVNRPELDASGRIIPLLVEATKNKIRTILRIALRHHHNAIVLGAFGCGVYKNPPAHMAQIFREVFEELEFRGRLPLIVFAILDGYQTHMGHNPNGNLAPFAREFAEWGHTQVNFPSICLN